MQFKEYICVDTPYPQESYNLNAKISDNFGLYINLSFRVIVKIKWSDHWIVVSVVSDWEWESKYLG